MVDLKIFNQKWEDVSAYEEATSYLLKLDILRDIYFEIHKNRSESLYHNNSAELLLNTELEKKVSYAIKLQSLPLNLNHYLDQHLKKDPHESPLVMQEGLKKILPEIKLTRFDREFEKIIAIRGFEQHCTFYELIYQLPLTNIQKFHELLKKTLWPKALLLFVESHQENKNNAKSMNGQWKGIWTTMLLPGVLETDIHPLLNTIKEKYTAHSIREMLNKEN